MVKLDRITTGTGDRGTTSLADGSRVAKNSPRVCAYGTVDELNSLLGVVLLEEMPVEIAEELRRIQNDLFDLGADLASPPGAEHEAALPRIDAHQVERLEGAIGGATDRLEPAESFILPGGSRAAAFLHLARTVARRTEREVLFLAEDAARNPRQPSSRLNPLCLTYLNRLSDLFFVFARLCNDGGRQDVLWQPGRNR